jgi:DNA-binding PadR family transcriptional regulator
MLAHAIYVTGEGRCGHGHRDDFRALWSAMAGGRGRSGGDAGEGHSGHGHHGGRRGRGFGGLGPAGGFGGFPFGPSGGGGPFGRGRKARRGDIRTAALLLLAEEPRNGYQIMQEVQERSEGAWRPSPGSVYPALQQLEDEGLIRSEEDDGRKRFVLTDAGKEYLNQRDSEAPAPWEQFSGEFSNQAAELGNLIREIAFAFTQVVRTGSEGQLGEARKVLVAARRDLYRILADGDPENR